MIKIFEVGAASEDLNLMWRDNRIENLHLVCQIPAPAAVEWVKDTEEAFLEFPKLSCWPNSTIPGGWEILGWVNKKFVIVQVNSSGRSLAISHSDYGFYLYQFDVKEVW